MPGKQIPKYHLAPTFSIPPSDAGGVLELGSIIKSIDYADNPINRDCHLRIPYSELFCNHQRNFSRTRSRMKSGEYGVWARVLGANGIGGEMSFAPERSDEDFYHFRSLDTIYFNPSKDYVEKSMGEENVKDHISASKYEPVYMVTGLKIARGPSVNMVNGRRLVLKAQLGLPQPGGIPIDLGPKFDWSRETMRNVGFEPSDDFVFGIRVTKLMFKKHWLITEVARTVESSPYNKVATVVDSAATARLRGEFVELDDDMEVEIQTDISDITGDGAPVQWLIQHT